jgi:hypothetical protein
MGRPAKKQRRDFTGFEADAVRDGARHLHQKTAPGSKQAFLICINAPLFVPGWRAAWLAKVAARKNQPGARPLAGLGFIGSAVFAASGF